jgi:hypothetical protein
MIVNNFLSLPTELQVLLLFGILMFIYELIKGIKSKWQKLKQRNHK